MSQPFSVVKYYVVYPLWLKIMFQIHEKMTFFIHFQTTVIWWPYSCLALLGVGCIPITRWVSKEGSIGIGNTLTILILSFFQPIPSTKQPKNPHSISPMYNRGTIWDQKKCFPLYNGMNHKITQIQAFYESGACTSPCRASIHCLLM